MNFAIKQANSSLIISQNSKKISWTQKSSKNTAKILLFLTKNFYFQVLQRKLDNITRRKKLVSFRWNEDCPVHEPTSDSESDVEIFIDFDKRLLKLDEEFKFRFVVN